MPTAGPAIVMAIFLLRFSLSPDNTALSKG
jgi:hypothetical protein